MASSRFFLTKKNRHNHPQSLHENFREMHTKCRTGFAVISEHAH